ncbi:sensor histidine kinase [Paenibacillus sacheonensis]|uniref:HAMP domain-containing protein n=1 Tax=Paenibacillus sacheonensis TaxID=742054 RepID=A0A7X4YWA6_9BACL|nr:sensor histidine kinase [Paenibacillus sacheonensis]MBM7569077.1 two-component system sensor histidine kinase YesM [Paenibacillus sacheonensis]NBC72744.1 HAMP domain-containing protein [Paenibacillus sacheonensis]
MRFRHLHSIVNQLFLFCFIGMTLPVLVMGFLSYNKSSAIVEEQVSKVASLTITQVSDKLNLFFKKLDDSSMMVLNSKLIQAVLEQKSETTPYELNEMVKNSKELLTSIMINSTEILDIYIFDVKRNNSVFSGDSLMSVPDQWDSDWYEAILKANGNTVWFGISQTSYLKKTETGFPVFGLGRAIRSWETGEIIGVMFYEIMADLLIDELDRVQFGDTGYIYVTNDENRYFYHPDPAEYGQASRIELPEKMRQSDSDKKKTLVIPEKLDNGWHVVGVVPLKELTADSASIRNFTLWIALGSIVLAVGMGVFGIRKIGNPLVNLSRLMKKGEAGDLTVRSGHIGRNEIGQLGRSFNKMIGQIALLIERISKEESEKKKAEIRALRYQINPHFLYNTLNSIRWMAKLNRTNDVDSAVTTLVQLLEGSLERGGVFGTIGGELELLEKYMIIQEYRYENKIELYTDCPEELLDVPIPRMLLQPIVENAIFHGIAPKEEKGTIAIQVQQLGEDLLIRIKDDGVGMDKELIGRLLISSKERMTKGMTSIGLRHVDQTIKLYYGNAYGVKVASAEGEGTSVLITFSRRKEDHYVQSAAR